MAKKTDTTEYLGTVPTKHGFRETKASEDIARALKFVWKDPTNQNEILSAIYLAQPKIKQMERTLRQLDRLAEYHKGCEDPESKFIISGECNLLEDLEEILARRRSKSTEI